MFKFGIDTKGDVFLCLLLLSSHLRAHTEKQVFHMDRSASGLVMTRLAYHRDVERVQAECVRALRNATPAAQAALALEDAQRADELFSILMGDDVAARRSFITRRAKDVRFLDV